MGYDVVIRNGTVVDGSGRPAYRADVGVVGDRIATIGRIREHGTDEIDAEGHLVTPGFIDGHTHFDAQLNWDPLGTCASYHGVTTAVMGNCGFTIAPCREDQKHLALRSLERAEDISGAAMEQGITWSWETFADYLDTVERLPKGINYAGYLGHSALRTYVMGERAYEQQANDDDLAAMRAELTSALRAGAIGFSTSRSNNHATSDDRPVASRLASWDEVRALVNTMGELGAGLFELAQEHYPEPEKRREYFDRMRDLAVESGRPITFVCGSNPYAPEVWQEFLALLDETAAVGGRMVGQVHTREFLSVIGFPVKLPFDKLPTWSQLRAQPLEAQLRDLATDGELRRRLVEEAEHGSYGGAIGAEARAPVWDLVRIIDAPDGPYRTVAEVAAARGASPVEVMIEATLAAGGQQFFMQPFANFDLDAVLAMLRHPRTVPSVSDSGAHVSQIIDSSIPTHLLAYWVRQQQAFTWEEAVRMLTFDPAGVWGFHDRGLLREGFRADVAVFDPDTIAPGMPTAAHDLPAGAVRLVQKAQGLAATVVNGQVLLRHNEHTGALPGRLLRGPLAQG